jgi:hypothetical protein
MIDHVLPHLSCFLYFLKKAHAPLCMSCSLVLTQESLGGTYESNAAEDSLEVVYDPSLNCYFDPRTQQYYQLV